MSRRNSELTFEHLKEALEKERGFILSAKKYLKREFNIDVNYKTVKARIEEWGMQEFIDDLRKSLVEDCLHRTFDKGINKGDNHCIFWVLEKYSHHIDFLGGKDTETESKKGWKVLLEYVKATPEPEANLQPQEQHSTT